MNQSEALEWVATLFQDATETIAMETPRSAVKDWDSLGVLTLMAALDEKFGLVVNDEEMRGMQRIGDIVELLRKNGKIT